MQGPDEFHVAIVGGGLCGLALSIALEKRGIPYMIYEAQASFSEIGAGINIAPNAIAAFNLIDPSLGDAVMRLATRNWPDPDVWMDIRLGAPTENFSDGHLVMQIKAPGVGNTTVGRNELLQLLASKIDLTRARFKKKLGGFDDSDGNITLMFEDKTTANASIVIGCDGIHSAARKTLFGPASEATFTGIGGYRAVFSIAQHEEAVGAEMARTSCKFSGPNGYVIMYPIDGGSKVNIGCWHRKPDHRPDASGRWVLQNQKAAMLRDFQGWGSTVHKVMAMMSEETSFWATHHHEEALEHYYRGRACLIGDAAHAMGPHQGQGVSQAMEDAYVMAEVLSTINGNDAEQINAAFSGFEHVRKPRAEWVAKRSHDGFSFWADFWRPGLTKADIKAREKEASTKFETLWYTYLQGQGDTAKEMMTQTSR